MRRYNYGLIVISVLLFSTALAKCNTSKCNKSKTDTKSSSAAIKQPVDRTTSLAKSKMANELEKQWKRLEIKRSYIDNQIIGLSGVLSKQTQAMSENIAKLMNNKTDETLAAVPGYKSVINANYKSTGKKCVDLKTLKRDHSDILKEQRVVTTNLTKVAESICENRDAHQDQFTKNTYMDIAARSKDIVDLLSKLDFELSIGALKNFTKCNSSPPVVCPASYISFDKNVYKSPDSRFKFFEFDVICRNEAMLFAPCYGTVTFIGTFKDIGSVMIISNNESHVVVSNVNKTCCTVGQVVYKGELVGVLNKSDGHYGRFKYIVRIKSPKK